MMDQEVCIYIFKSILYKELHIDINFKNLKRIFPCDDSMVVIVDDREDVWMTPDRRVSANLIKITPCIKLFIYYLNTYTKFTVHYFSTTAEINALPTDSNSNGVSHPIPEDHYLQYIGDVLKHVHQEYYSNTTSNNNNNTTSKDVKVY
jgi:hypothetical protein